MNRQPGLQPAPPRPGLGPAGRGIPQNIMAQQFMALHGKFAATLNGEQPYLEPGATSRLVLSLRSGLPEEMDFGLERLVQASDFDPDLLPLQHHVFLVEVLLDIIEAQVDRRRDELRLHPWATHFRATLEDPRVRRACEAGLVLRNLTTTERNLPYLQQQAGKRLVRVIVETLELGLAFADGRYGRPGPSDGDNLDELKLYMLEILEVLTPVVRLQPLQPDDTPPLGPIVGATSEARGAERRLVPLLTALSYSTDRSFVLSSLRTLAELAKVDAHEALFSAPDAIAADHSPLARALELMPLQDAAINAVALEYLYAVTNSAAVAIDLTNRVFLLSLLRHLVYAITRGGLQENWEIDVQPALRLPHRSPPAPISDETQTTSAKLPPDVLQQIVALPEPHRTKQWMQYVYEPAPGAEITQVDLWQAYRREFEPHDREYKMMAAADVIKLSNEAFSTAQAMVTTAPDRKFIIRGIRVKTRHDFTAMFRCQWTGCPSPRDPAVQEPDSLYRHIRDTHVRTTEGRCQWTGCRYQVPVLQTVDGMAHADIVANALSLHIRTHIPSPSMAIAGSSASTQEGRDVVPMRVLNTQRSEDGVPIGRGFLAAFALRNIARAIRSGLAPGQDHADRSGVSDLYAVVAGSSANEDDADSAPVRMSTSAARQAAEAFLSIEHDLVRLLFECKQVVQPLSEVMDLISLAHTVLAREVSKMPV